MCAGPLHIQLSVLETTCLPCQAPGFHLTNVTSYSTLMYKMLPSGRLSPPPQAEIGYLILSFICPLCGLLFKHFFPQIIHMCFSLLFCGPDSDYILFIFVSFYNINT